MEHEIIALERREDVQRFPTSRPSKIILRSKEFSYQCMIKNFSWRGLRLVTEEFLSIPEQFYVQLAENESELHLCDVIWRKQRHIGIQFAHS